MRTILSVLLLVVATSSYAGTACNAEAPRASNVVKALNFGETVTSYLNSIDPIGNNVYLIGRVGQDLSKYNQKYSHGGLIYKVENDWWITHELNGCGSETSSIYTDTVPNFYMDNLFKFESVLVQIKPTLGGILRKMLQTPEEAIKMHGRNYNMLAYPFNTKYQNSNGWLLETIVRAAAVQQGTHLNTRAEVQSYLQTLGYTPDTINVGMFTRLGARMTKANIAFDDQPFDSRMAGEIKTVTFDGLIKFISSINLVSNQYELN